jgi:hypothetical protein
MQTWWANLRYIKTTLRFTSFLLQTKSFLHFIANNAQFSNTAKSARTILAKKLNNNNNTTPSHAQTGTYMH